MQEVNYTDHKSLLSVIDPWGEKDISSQTGSWLVVTACGSDQQRMAKFAGKGGQEYIGLTVDLWELRQFSNVRGDWEFLKQ